MTKQLFVYLDHSVVICQEEEGLLVSLFLSSCLSHKLSLSLTHTHTHTHTCYFTVARKVINPNEKMWFWAEWITCDVNSLTHIVKMIMGHWSCSLWCSHVFVTVSPTTAFALTAWAGSGRRHMFSSESREGLDGMELVRQWVHLFWYACGRGGDHRGLPQKPLHL